MSDYWSQYAPAQAAAPQVGKLNPADQTVLTQMQQDAEQKRVLAERAQEFMAKQQAGGGVATGPGYGHIKVPLLGDLGSPGQVIRSAMDLVGHDNQASRLQDLDSIANQTWPLLRPAGQGRLLQTEAEAFKKAFPSTQNYGTANQEITGRLGGEAQSAGARVNFIRQYVASGKGGVNEAASAWDAQNRAQQNTALKAKSAQAKASPVIDFATGKPVQ